MTLKFDNGDQVIREGLYVTVRIGDLKVTRKYFDLWNAERAVSRLQKGPEARRQFLMSFKVSV
jgi:hypothetical protein